MEDILVPIALFAIIPLTVWAVSYYRYKSRARIAETVQSIAASGQNVDETLIKSFAMPVKRKNSDLRSGMIAIAIGLGLLFSSGVADDSEAQAGLAALSSFPILIGIALLAFWFFVGRKEA